MKINKKKVGYRKYRVEVFNETQNCGTSTYFDDGLKAIDFYQKLTLENQDCEIWEYKWVEQNFGPDVLVQEQIAYHMPQYTPKKKPKAKPANVDEFIEEKLVNECYN